MTFEIKKFIPIGDKVYVYDTKHKLTYICEVIQYTIGVTDIKN